VIYVYKRIYARLRESNVYVSRQRMAVRRKTRKIKDLRTSVITIRVTPALRDRLEKIAESQRRTLSSMLEIQLEKIADDEEK
jgi:hypothetical protein